MRKFPLYISLFISIFSVVTVRAQSQTELQLKQHVYFLADDKLEGRATGSEGEIKAAEYIAAEFKQLGLLPAGDNNSYIDTFKIHAGKVAGEGNSIGGLKAVIMNPVIHTMSANGTAVGNLIDAGYGISANAIEYDDYKGLDAKDKIVLIKLSSPEGNTPHSKFADYADERVKIKTAQDKGAIGVIFYNTDTTYDEPQADYRRTITSENIPVIFVTKEQAADLVTYRGALTLTVQLNEVIKTARNVIGYINNNAPTTVIIGAHYDHLGHGEIEGSLYRGAPAIHNGADDNASGVALIIEMAEKLKSSYTKNNNYLFIAFSGEEMGLFGSKAFTNSELIKKYDINYMLNYDMVGRLDSNKTLIINGTGTSPEWTLLNNLSVDDIKIKTTESGIGPSDQTSFYLKDIPVLHFFTGSHSDYHKPGDDAEKINYRGIEEVMDYSMALIDSVNIRGKIAFTKTKEDNNENAPKFTVTMGVIPDYAFSGKGMRIDGVSDGKPAQKAGILAGDVVIKLGNYEVADLMGYMGALSKFVKGDATMVTILRNNEELTLPIQF